MHPGDMMDNDCDGKIDEEMPGSDVDSDNQISEDLRRGVAVHGVWEQWERWGCDDECTGKFMTRRRYCYQPLPFYEGAPCQGHDLETKDTPCMSDRCVEDVCPPGFYGRACEHQCQNCAGFCNRRDGTCPLCRPGWIGFHCDVACPPMTYGLECQHSCSKKCNGKDCIDRVFGYCQPAMDLIAFMVVYYLLLSIVLSGLCYLMFCYTVEKIERTEIVTVKRVSSKEFTLTKQVYEHC
ncbi:scavenger receptor class F member 2-like [Physella acuta]|uniref:scavenger receptor class F member 2-like n=1 Tax=Physella acuta TaxID=109671 RepID=UPI0027DBF0A7|nr:scavenger receptor class F member 2-like [Physella acuta]